MPWARLDDSFHSNRKVRRAWNAHGRAVGLYALALTYCNGQANDGVIDREWVAQWLPNGKAMEAVCGALVGALLWHEHADGWEIHDYLDYNPSAQEVRAKRKADAARQADYRARRNGVTPDELTRESQGPRARVPSHPNPVKERDQRERKSPGRGPLGPSHDDANAAGLSWAAYKAERQRQHLQDRDDAR